MSSNSKLFTLNFTKAQTSLTPTPSFLPPAPSFDQIEEEKYLALLREQISKIEHFQTQLHKKDLKIKDLESQLQKFSTASFSHELNFLTSELKEKEENNQSLQYQLKRQMDDYEESLIQIGNKIQETEKNLSDLNEENFKLKAVIEGFEEKKMEEFEGLSEKLNELFEENQVLTENYLKLKRSSEGSTSPNKAGGEYKVRLAQKEQELALSKRSHSEYVNRTEIEIKSLQNELQRAISVVSRQEKTILALRQMNSEGDSKSCTLSTEPENPKFGRKTPNKENKELNSNDQLSLITAENKKLKQKILEMKESATKVKQERKQIATLKMQMLSQRTIETSKLTKALNSVILSKNYQ